MRALAIAMWVVATSGAAGTTADPASPLALSLELDRAATPAHAPFQFWLSLRNQSSVMVEGRFDLSLARAGASIEFGKSGGPLSALAYLDERVVPSRDGDPRKTLFQHFNGPRPTALESGEEIVNSGILAIDPYRRAFLLAGEGDYELRATTFDPVTQSRLVSNTVRITVRPATSGEKEAVEAFTPDMALLAQYHWSVDQLPVVALHEAGRFLERFGSSDYTFLLRRGLQQALRGRRGAAEIALASQLAQEDGLSPPVPPGGRERAAYDALTPELDLILHHGEYGSSGEARNLPIHTLQQARDYVRRFGGTTYARHIEFKLEGILVAKKRTNRITAEEKALLESLQRK